MKFESLLHLAEHFAHLAVKEVEELHHGMERCAKLVERTAKDEIGHYQPQIGPFPAWVGLADSTKDDRVNKGFPENDPLLRTGDLRDSITHESSATEAVIGSTSDIMAYQEFGTIGAGGMIPARPVLGPAAFKSKEKIKAIIGEAAMCGYFNYKGQGGVQMEGKTHESLGYDMEVK